MRGIVSLVIAGTLAAGLATGVAQAQEPEFSGHAYIVEEGGLAPAQTSYPPDVNHPIVFSGTITEYLSGYPIVAPIRLDGSDDGVNWTFLSETQSAPHDGSYAFNVVVPYAHYKISSGAVDGCELCAVESLGGTVLDDFILISTPPYDNVPGNNFSYCRYQDPQPGTQNTAPVVHAGYMHIIDPEPPPGLRGPFFEVELQGEAYDDPNQVLTYEWKLLSAGTVTIADSTAAVTRAWFDVGGEYTFEFSAFDGELYGYAHVTIKFTDLRDGLVLHFPFDEGSGDTADDCSGNGRTGHFSGDVQWTEGYCGGALEFNGTDTYIDVPYAVPDLQDATAEAWVCADHTEGWPAVVGQGLPVKAYPWNVWKLGLTPERYARLEGALGGLHWTVVGTSNVCTGEWTHVAGTFDGRYMKIFVDGALEGTTDVGPDPGPTSTSDSVPCVGAIRWGNEVGDFFHGKIDELRVYSRALSEEEIRATRDDCGYGCTGNTLLRDDFESYSGTPEVFELYGTASGDVYLEDGYAHGGEKAILFVPGGVNPGDYWWIPLIHSCLPGDWAGGPILLSLYLAGFQGESPLEPYEIEPLKLSDLKGWESPVFVFPEYGEPCQPGNVSSPWAEVHGQFEPPDSDLSDLYLLGRYRPGRFYYVDDLTFRVASPLPDPGYESLDIGDPRRHGGFSYDSVNGRFYLESGGADIWGTFDEFHYVFKPRTGNGELSARVMVLQGTDPWTKAGVMVRQHLDAYSRHVSVGVTPSSGVYMQWRRTPADVTYHTPGSAATTPHWVKVRRMGNTFSGYESDDGDHWTLIDTQTLPMMLSSAYWGLLLTSHDDSNRSKAIFDNVKFVPLP